MGDMKLDLQNEKNTLWPTANFQTATPESVGIDSSVLVSQLEKCVGKNKLHSVLIMRGGYLVSETYFDNYTEDTAHDVYSITKGILSTLTGIAIQQGKILNVDQCVIDFFPDVQLPESMSYKNDITIRHLLTMTSGIRGDERWSEFENAEDIGEAIFLLSQKSMPGEKYFYDSAAAHLLGCVVSKAVGTDLYTYADEYLFKPLGIRLVVWEQDNKGNYFGGFGISMTPRDMVRFGYLYLNDGRWENSQVLSADWVKAVRPETPGLKKYGFMFWSNGQKIPENFEASGSGGQHILIFPSLNMVLVITANTTMKTSYLTWAWLAKPTTQVLFFVELSAH